MIIRILNMLNAFCSLWEKMNMRCFSQIFFYFDSFTVYASITSNVNTIGLFSHFIAVDQVVKDLSILDYSSAFNDYISNPNLKKNLSLNSFLSQTLNFFERFVNEIFVLLCSIT